MIYYIIINTTDLPKIDFTKFLDDNENSLTKNVDETLCILKFKGEIPRCLNGIEIVRFVGREFHSNRQMILMKKIINEDLSYGWVKEEEK